MDIIGTIKDKYMENKKAAPLINAWGEVVEE